MNTATTLRRLAFGAVVVGALVLTFQWGTTPVAVADGVPDFQLDDTCTASLQGRPDVRVNSDGTFRVRNIPGVREILDRVTGICVRNGETIYWRSPCFTIAPNSFNIVPNDFVACMEPFAEVKDLDCTSPVQTLTGVGQQVQLQVLGTLTNDAVVDLTTRADCTQYLSTNPAIATVDENGLVTAGQTNGTVFVIVTNTGKIDFCRLNVALGDPLTKVVGNVKLPDGEGGGPAVGATVIARGVEGTTDANGDFCLEDVPTLDENDQLVDIVVNASLDGLTGNSDPTTPVPAGITDVGMFSLDFSKDSPTLRIGEPADFSRNCFPFGCSSNRRYQQVIRADEFPGPIVIENLATFHRPFGALPLLADYVITLSTTSRGTPDCAQPGTLSRTFEENLGADATLVLAARTRGQAFDDNTRHVFEFTTPFCYDPSQGNLLIQIFKSNATGATNFFDVIDQSNPKVASRLFSSSTVGPGSDDRDFSIISHAMLFEFNSPTDDPDEAEPNLDETEDHTIHTEAGTRTP